MLGFIPQQAHCAFQWHLKHNWRLTVNVYHVHNAEMHLKHFMFRAGLTDHALGKILQCDHSTINRYKNHECSPSFQRAVQIHEYTGGQVSASRRDWPILNGKL